MSNYQKGAARERDWAKRLEAQGWVVARCAGSKGEYDLMASRVGHTTQLIEVKSTKAGPYSTFGPAKREALLEAAYQAGAVALLVWWPADRKGPRIIPASAWPGKDGI